MNKRVLILGGRGRIGSSVAADLLSHTPAEVTITGRAGSLDSQPHADRLTFLPLDLEEVEKLSAAVQDADLVIHCAGPFRYRDTRVLQCCIEQGINYLDVSDDRSFTRKALSHCEAAEAAGITAIVNTGVFPGISNSMVRQGVEQFDQPELIHLSYVVAGSGGAGVTVMRTTFLGLQHPFEVWLDGRWQAMQPYTGRETVEFPRFGRSGVYWFDMPEAYTLPATFPVKTVITKFGSVPDLYNHLTWMTARFPARLIQHPAAVEFLAHVSHRMTGVSDRLSGIGVAMRAEVQGQKQGQPARYCATFAHSNTAVAAAYGTGSLAELLLNDQLNKPGVWAVEQALSTPLFEQAMQSRKVVIQQDWLS